MLTSEVFKQAVIAYLVRRTDDVVTGIVSWNEEVQSNGMTCSCAYHWTTVTVVYTRINAYDVDHETGHYTYHGSFLELLEDLLYETGTSYSEAK